MHTWSKVYSLKIANVDGFWTMYVSCMNHCQSNFSSLFFYFHFLLERLIVQSIWFFSCNFSSPPEYNRGSSFHRSSRRFPILRSFFFFFTSLETVLQSSLHRFINESSASNVPIYHRRSRVQFIIPRNDAFIRQRFLSSRARETIHADRFSKENRAATRARAPTYTTRACAWTKMAVV